MYRLIQQFLTPEPGLLRALQQHIEQERTLMAELVRPIREMEKVFAVSVTGIRKASNGFNERISTNDSEPRSNSSVVRFENRNR